MQAGIEAARRGRLHELNGLKIQAVQVAFSCRDWVEWKWEYRVRRATWLRQHPWQLEAVSSPDENMVSTSRVKKSSCEILGHATWGRMFVLFWAIQYALIFIVTVENECGWCYFAFQEGSHRILCSSFSALPVSSQITTQKLNIGYKCLTFY